MEQQAKTLPTSQIPSQVLDVDVIPDSPPKSKMLFYGLGVLLLIFLVGGVYIFSTKCTTCYKQNTLSLEKSSELPTTTSFPINSNNNNATSMQPVGDTSSFQTWNFADQGDQFSIKLPQGYKTNSGEDKIDGLDVNGNSLRTEATYDLIFDVYIHYNVNVNGHFPDPNHCDTDETCYQELYTAYNNLATTSQGTEAEVKMHPVTSLILGKTVKGIVTERDNGSYAELSYMYPMIVNNKELTFEFVVSYNRQPGNAQQSLVDTILSTFQFNQ